MPAGPACGCPSLAPAAGPRDEITADTVADLGAAGSDQRELRRFARDHGLRRIVASGSAARGDAGAHSDVDLLVGSVDARKPSLFELTDMAAEAEGLFGRDVDIVVGPSREPAWRSAIDREGVVLVTLADERRLSLVGHHRDEGHHQRPIASRLYGTWTQGSRPCPYVWAVK